jgi:hypothetical protein
MRLAHRVTSTAAPDQVWALLGTPRRWPEFDPLLSRVHGAPDVARTGQTLLGIARLSGLRIPLDVVEAVPEQRLELFWHTAPGLAQRVVYEVARTLRGGSSIRVGAVVEGLFAPAAVVPVWLSNGLVVRVLAARAERAAQRGREGSGAA